MHFCQRGEKRKKKRSRSLGNGSECAAAAAARFYCPTEEERGGFIGLKGKRGFFLSCSGKKDNIAQVF